jgi:hypothetical protein
MFAHMINGFKESTSSALRLTSLAAAVAVALFVMLSFLCAAAFVYVLQTYGLILACLTGAGIFLVVALIAAAFYLVRRNPRHRRQETDSDTGRRRPGIGIAGQPPGFNGRSAGRVTKRATLQRARISAVIASVSEAIHAAARKSL